MLGVEVGVNIRQNWNSNFLAFSLCKTNFVCSRIFDYNKQKKNLSAILQFLTKIKIHKRYRQWKFWKNSIKYMTHHGHFLSLMIWSTVLVSLFLCFEVKIRRRGTKNTNKNLIIKYPCLEFLRTNIWMVNSCNNVWIAFPLNKYSKNCVLIFLNF